MKNQEIKQAFSQLNDLFTANWAKDYRATLTEDNDIEICNESVIGILTQSLIEEVLNICNENNLSFYIEKSTILIF